jgi:hypothetical protein
LGSNILGLIKRSSWSPIRDSPAPKPVINSLFLGPTELEKVAVKELAQYLLMEPTLCHLFTNKEGNSSFPSLHAYKEQLVFFLKPFLVVLAQPIGKCSKTVGHIQDP